MIRNCRRLFPGCDVPLGKWRKDDYRERIHGLDVAQYADGDQRRWAGQDVLQGTLRRKNLSEHLYRPGDGMITFGSSFPGKTVSVEIGPGRAFLAARGFSTHCLPVLAGCGSRPCPSAAWPWPSDPLSPQETADIFQSGKRGTPGRAYTLSGVLAQEEISPCGKLNPARENINPGPGYADRTTVIPQRLSSDGKRNICPGTKDRGTDISIKRLRSLFRAEKECFVIIL